MVKEDKARLQTKMTLYKKDPLHSFPLCKQPSCNGTTHAGTAKMCKELLSLCILKWECYRSKSGLQFRPGKCPFVITMGKAIHRSMGYQTACCFRNVEHLSLLKIALHPFVEIPACTIQPLPQIK